MSGKLSFIVHPKSATGLVCTGEGSEQGTARCHLYAWIVSCFLFLCVLLNCSSGKFLSLVGETEEE